MEETRYMIKRGLNLNCQKRPDFIEDVLLQKDLFASYDMIKANPAYEPTYTFTEPDSPSNEFNPTSHVNESDKHQPFITGEHGVSSKADCSYGTNKGSSLLTVEPILDTVVEDHNYEEDPSTQVWQHYINVNLMPEFLCADGGIPCKEFFGFCMDQDRQGVNLAAVDVPELTMNRNNLETTIDVSDYEVDPFIQVEQKNRNIVEGLKLTHIGNKITTELADHEIDQNWEGADLDIFDVPQLSMDAIPMENILDGSDNEEVPFVQVNWEGADLDIFDVPQLSMDAIPMENILERSDNEEVPFMQVKCDYMNIDSLGQMLSGIENDISSEPVDMGAADIPPVNNDASPTEQNEAMPVFFTDKENHEVMVLERNVRSPVALGTSLGKHSLDGQSRSKSPSNRSNHRRSRSVSCGRYRSPTNRRNWRSPSKLLRASRSPVKSKNRCYRSSSRSVTNSSSHRRSQSCSRSGVYSRAPHRRSDSRSGVNSRDCNERSQSRLKFGMDSRDCSRRTRSRSRSPITLRDHKRRSRSRSPSNSRGSHSRSRSRSATNSRNSHIRSHSHSRPVIHSRDHHRRSYSRSRVNSRYFHSRPQSRLKVGMNSRGSNRRTWSRSRSPVTLRDHRRRFRSRSPSNSKGSSSRSQSHSPRDIRDL